MLAFLAGCAGMGGTSQPRAPNVNLSGYPPAFREGYLDGCETGRALIGIRKDERRFRDDAQYAQGWRDGYDICRRR
ncbi:MAG: hypothetical protein HYU77_04930 [Betaproteobacteria bacterium]|nr:hypothetical protein [Betaproteobacteria bacterium]